MDQAPSTPDAQQSAESGRLDTIPSEILARVNWTEPSVSVVGLTLLHWAAWNGYLDQLPPEVLTAGNLLVSDMTGNTPLHAAALFGHLNQVPREVLTAENLTVRDFFGQTPLTCARSFDDLDQLLGIELSDDCKEIVGDIWWEKNQDILARKARPQNFSDPAPAPASSAIELD